MAEIPYINPNVRGAHLAEVRSSKRVREAVFMVVLQRQGTSMDPEAEQDVLGDVTAIAQEFYVSKKEMRALMLELEPTLQFGSDT